MQREDIEDIYELSPLQHGVLFHELRDQHSRLYVVQNSIDVDAAVEPAALRQAWEHVASRHSVLRTSFHWQELDKPLELVHRRIAISLDVRDLSNLAAAAALATMQSALD